MKITLKTKLICSYAFISLLLVGMLLTLSNILVERQFQSYLQDSQARKTSGVVEQIQTQWQNFGEPSNEYFSILGQNLLNEGMILSIENFQQADASDHHYGNTIFNMQQTDKMGCHRMMGRMRKNTSSRVSNFTGNYTEKTTPIIIGNEKVASATIGYQGPFYYADADVAFAKTLNKLFLWISLLAVFLAFIMGVYSAAKITNPIKSVIENTKKIQRGELQSLISIKTKTLEVDELILSVNALAQSLANQKNIQKQLAGDYAHEFRTPLATLQSNLEGMIDGVFEPTPERLESCNEEVIRLSRMMAGIDRIVEIENSVDVLKKEKFDLAALVRQICINFEHSLREKNIKLELNVQKLNAFADKDKMSQVVYNLISNAIKYTDECGKIIIDLQAHKNKVVLKVSDSGIGIDSKDIEHVFEHLYRSDRSRSRDTGGAGIGLSVVKSIALAHGGKVFAKSQIGKGSEFVFEFPQ